MKKSNILCTTSLLSAFEKYRLDFFDTHTHTHNSVCLCIRYRYNGNYDIDTYNYMMDFLDYYYSVDTMDFLDTHNSELIHCNAVRAALGEKLEGTFRSP